LRSWLADLAVRSYIRIVSRIADLIGAAPAVPAASGGRRVSMTMTTKRIYEDDYSRGDRETEKQLATLDRLIAKRRREKAAAEPANDNAAS